MNLRYFGPHIPIRESCTICLAFLLTAVSTTRSRPLGRALNNAGDYSMDWEGTFDSIWNKTKFWTSDAETPTDYLPEDEGYIRVYSPKAKPAPRLPSPKTTKPAAPKKQSKTSRDTVTKRKLLQLNPEGDSWEHSTVHMRNLLQTDSSWSAQMEEGGGLDGEAVVTTDDLVEILGGMRGNWMDEEEGSGEGSGFGSFDFWSPSSTIFVTEVTPILPLTPMSVRSS